MNSSLDALLDTTSPDELIATIRQRAEEKNRAAQSALAVPPAMNQEDWDSRKAWLLDGQAIYGELKQYFWPALIALKNDDQAEYSRQRDILFKALRTFLGDPPPPLSAEPLEVTPASPVAVPADAPPESAVAQPE